MLPEDKELQNKYEALVRTDAWIHLSAWIKEQANWSRMSGATKDNFDFLKGQINAYQSVLSEVEKYLNIKLED